MVTVRRMLLAVPLLAAGCAAQAVGVASGPPAEAFSAQCEGATTLLDREYLEASAEAALRAEAPGMLGLPAEELVFVRGGKAPNGPSILFNARRDGELVGVLAVRDEPGASGVEYYTACGRSRLPEPVDEGSPAPVSSPAPTAAPPGEAARWGTDATAPPVASERSFTALVTRIGCNGGVTGEVLPADVVETDDRVVLTFSVREKPPGAASCPGNDPVPTRVTLSAPVGDRTLVDGTCLSGMYAGGSDCGDGGKRWPS